MKTTLKFVWKQRIKEMLKRSFDSKTEKLEICYRLLCKNNGKLFVCNMITSTFVARCSGYEDIFRNWSTNRNIVINPDKLSIFDKKFFERQSANFEIFAVF